MTSTTPGSSPDDLQAFANKYYSSDRRRTSSSRRTTFGINYLIPQVKTTPLNSVDAREAVSYAIDRDAIIKGI